MKVHLIQFVMMWAHAHGYHAIGNPHTWYALHIGNGCGAIHSGNWTC